MLLNKVISVLKWIFCQFLYVLFYSNALLMSVKAYIQCFHCISNRNNFWSIPFTSLPSSILRLIWCTNHWYKVLMYYSQVKPESQLNLLDWRHLFLVIMVKRHESTKECNSWIISVNANNLMMNFICFLKGSMHYLANTLYQEWLIIYLQLFFL